MNGWVFLYYCCLLGAICLEIKASFQFFRSKISAPTEVSFSATVSWLKPAGLLLAAWAIRTTELRKLDIILWEPWLLLASVGTSAIVCAITLASGLGELAREIQEEEWEKQNSKDTPNPHGRDNTNESEEEWTDAP